MQSPSESKCCPAQVIARRALLLWLYDELEACQQSNHHLHSSKQAGQNSYIPGDQLKAQPSVSATSSCQSWHSPTEGRSACLRLFEQSSSRRFRRLDGWRLHMFVSQLPCGDACIFPASAADSAHQDPTSSQANPMTCHRTGAKHLRTSALSALDQAASDQITPVSPRPSNPLAENSEAVADTHAKQHSLRCDAADPLLASMETHNGSVQTNKWEASQEVGVLRRKPGRGTPTQSLSCRCCLHSATVSHSWSAVLLLWHGVCVDSLNADADHSNRFKGSQAKCKTRVHPASPCVASTQSASNVQ